MSRKKAAPVDTCISCAVCSTREPLATAHDHHRLPRAFGGTDDAENRVWLCASCHTRLHRVQSFIMMSKSASGFELCKTVFPSDAKARANLWQFANEAAVAEQNAKEVFSEHRTKRKVMIEVDINSWEVIKVLAKNRKKTASALAAEIIESAAKGMA